DMAVAVGDLLFSRAFAELVRNGRIDEVRVLSEASSALAAGELLQREDAWRADVTVERYLRRCELKTARLFEAACELGALEAGGPARELGAFGRRIGLAFQLLDDVLDVSGPPERTGKPRWSSWPTGSSTATRRRRGSPRARWVVLEQELASQPLLDHLAHRVAGQLVDEVDLSRALVGREELGDVPRELVGRSVGPRLADDPGRDALAEVGVGPAGHGDLGHR